MARRGERPNANFKQRFNHSNQLQKQLEVRDEFNYLEYLSQDEINSLSPKIVATLKNGNGIIKGCMNCGRYVFVPRKTYYQFKGYYIRRYGGWSCKGCNSRIKDGKNASDPNQRETEKHKGYKMVFLKKQAADDKREGITRS